MSEKLDIKNKEVNDESEKFYDDEVYDLVNQMLSKEGVGKVTQEEFDKAIEEVEKLRNLANNETKFEEFTFNVKKFLNGGSKESLYLFGLLSGLPFTLVNRLISGKDSTDELLRELRDSINAKLPLKNDAKTELKDLIKKNIHTL